MGTSKWDKLLSVDSPVNAPMFAGLVPPPATPAEQGAPQAFAAHVRAKRSTVRGAAANLMGPAEDSRVFTLHSDLEILDADDIGDLTQAMSNKASFFAIVPDFLDRWRIPDSPTLTLAGLDAISDLIRAHALKRTRHWRFALVPPVDPTSRYALEISLIMNLTALVTDAADRDTVYAGMQPGSPNDAFLNALAVLYSYLGNATNAPAYPGAVQVLQAVFPAPAAE